jgi:superfamily II DNA or RNA helicase|nr:MAG TPA: Chromatin remodeling complex ATPase [Crassvirales sp.]
MTKDAIAEQALELAKSHKHLILNWATGVGKSKAAIDIATLASPARILLIVAEIAHKENWKQEFEKWNSGLWSRVTVECYASLKNYRDTEWDMIILDEGHHARSGLRTDILSTLKAERVVVLTATLSLDDEFQIAGAFGGDFYKFTIPLKDAISWGILPVPRIYLVPLSLSMEGRSETIEESWGDSKKRTELIIPFERLYYYLGQKKMMPPTTLRIKCNQVQKYNYLTNKVEYFKRQFLSRRQEFIKNKWLQYGIMRKRALSDFKTEVLKELLERLKERRFICFCGSIEQADLLGGDNAIHSGKASPLKTIERFNRKEISSLVAVNMLQEGQNLTDIEVGIIAQLDGQERAFIQKFGRTLRAADPIQIILYFRGTRDEEYLEKALEGIDMNYVYTVEDLSEIPL